MNCREYRELIAAHVDGALSFEESREAQSHVEQCATCRRMFVWETKTQKVIKPHLAIIAPPSGTKERILDSLEQKGGSREMLGWFVFSPRLAGAFALVLVVVLATILWRNNSQDDFLGVAVNQYRTVLAKGPGASEQAGLSTPAARRLDLSPWGYRLTFNQINQVKGREQRLSLFEGQANDYVVAQEFDGAALSPSPDAMITRAENREFISYSRGGVNLVAWKDNDLLCVLTSKLANEELLALARQIAVRG
jgi:anti-sigma factor RsiW